MYSISEKSSKTICNNYMHVFRGVHGHFHGSLPWWKIEDTVVSESAKLVGNYNFWCAFHCENAS